jgi:hypothetical protein
LGGNRTSHGMTHTHLYKVWNNMKQKCYNPKNDNFQYYGGKGIVVCEEWENFENFKQWSEENGYKKGLVLHRKKSDYDYEPLNCEWISKDEHLAKRGKTGEVLTAVINGVEKTLTELSKETGISREALKYRLLRGYKGEELIKEVRQTKIINKRKK